LRTNRTIINSIHAIPDGIGTPRTTLLWSIYVFV